MVCVLHNDVSELVASTYEFLALIRTLQTLLQTNVVLFAYSGSISGNSCKTEALLGLLMKSSLA